MQGLRILLYPFSILYDGITGLRNIGFDKGWLKETRFKTRIIAVGNLSTGGTGKTPMIEYLIRQHTDKKVAVLSRGYGRKTKGYLEASSTSLSMEVGDEPLQFKLKYPDAIVAVCEKRIDGVEQLIEQHSPELILLDDAYQHRYVKASEYILLTSYDKLYFRDYLLPAGDLRESRTGADRADSIIVTKCPSNLSPAEMQSIKSRINPKQHQQVYFATISYAEEASGMDTKILLSSLNGKNVAVITGIAKPKFFIDHLKSNMMVEHMKFPDHHHFSDKEIESFRKHEVILTTEKDFVRLREYGMKNLFYVPIEMKFLGTAFNS